MAKTSGTTKTVSSANAAASRTLQTNAATGNGANNEKLPDGWSRDMMSNSIYNTNVKINDEAKHALYDIYGSSVSFGGGPNGDSINANSLSLAKEVAEHGKNLTYMYKGYNAAKTEKSKKYYENEIRTYIADAKKNKVAH